MKIKRHKTLHGSWRSWAHLFFLRVWSAKPEDPQIWAPWLMTPLHGAVFEVWELTFISVVSAVNQWYDGPTEEKNNVNLGKNAKNRLKIKEKAEILAQENFQKWRNQLKRGTLTPLAQTFCQRPNPCFTVSLIIVIYVSISFTLPCKVKPWSIACILNHDQQHRSHITQYRCGYCKVEYLWGYSLRVFCICCDMHMQ